MAERIERIAGLKAQLEREERGLANYWLRGGIITTDTTTTDYQI